MNPEINDIIIELDCVCLNCEFMFSENEPIELPPYRDFDDIEIDNIDIECPACGSKDIEKRLA